MFLEFSVFHFVFPVVQVSRFPGFQVSRFPGVQVSRCPGFQVCRTACFFEPFGQDTVGTRIKVIPSFGKGTLPTLFFQVGSPQGYPSDLSPACHKRYVSKTKYMNWDRNSFPAVKWPYLDAEST